MHVVNHLLAMEQAILVAQALGNQVDNHRFVGVKRGFDQLLNRALPDFLVGRVNGSHATVGTGQNLHPRQALPFGIETPVDHDFITDLELIF